MRRCPARTVRFERNSPAQLPPHNESAGADGVRTGASAGLAAQGPMSREFAAIELAPTAVAASLSSARSAST